MRSLRPSPWIVFWVLALILFFFPINNLMTRCGLLGSAVGAGIASLWYFRKSKVVFYGLILTFGLMVLCLVLPGRKDDPLALRSAYVDSLQSYIATPFVWGGESRLGVDCSGLIRIGLYKALCLRGIKTLNSKLLRSSVDLWWHDCSAKALGEQYRGLTKPVASASSINNVDHQNLQPGDIAVTANGVHVMAYLGGNKWIEADPAIGKVVVVKVPDKENDWFDIPVNILRWTQLEAK